VPGPVAEPAVQPPIYERESRHSLLDFLADVPPPKPSVEPIGFAHNGFHVDEAQRFQPLSRFESIPAPKDVATHKPDILSSDYPIDFGDHLGSESPDDRPSRHQLPEEEGQRYRFSGGRHARIESDDASSYGRHSRHGRD